MSFSPTDLSHVLRMLSIKLPQFSAQQVRVNRLLRVVTDRLSARLNEDLKTFGITENLWFAVMAVYVSPDSQILPSQLSNLMDLTRTSATRLSDEMVSKGWIERHVNPQDRRQIVLKLTQNGADFIHKVWPQLADASDQIWEDFSTEEFQKLEELLGKLFNRLNKE